MVVRMPLGEGRGRGGGTGSPVYWLDRYVPQDRVWFLSTPSGNRVSFFPLLVLRSRCDSKIYWDNPRSQGPLLLVLRLGTRLIGYRKARKGA